MPSASLRAPIHCILAAEPTNLVVAHAGTLCLPEQLVGQRAFAEAALEVDQCRDLVDEPEVDLAPIVDLLIADAAAKRGGNGPKAQVVWPPDQLLEFFDARPGGIFPAEILGAAFERSHRLYQGALE
jgi:hypothetical protein